MHLGHSGEGVFPKTRWSVVLEAQEEDPAALAKLCGDYWMPLYRFARRKGMSPADAEDLTQAFFERLLSRELLGSARKERGKLRDFLLTSFSRFSVEEWRRATTQKRGGGQTLIAIDVLTAESEIAAEPHHHLTPEREFQRSWARTALAQAVGKVRADYAASGKSAIFQELEDQLVDGCSGSAYREIGARLGLSEASTRFAAFKLRQRFREVLYGIIADTVTSREEAELEMAELQGVFRD